MGKHSGKKDREDKARRRLVKAQLALHAAQEQRAHAITRAERELERAKQRGTKWVADATERVERRAGAMARAEARLMTVVAPKRPEPAQPVAAAGSTTTSEESVRLTVFSQVEVADMVEQRELEAPAPGDSNSIASPDSAQADARNASNGNETTEEGELHPW